MHRGLYVSAMGMTTQMNKMDVVSNNIANANTTGYKKDGVITKTFDDEYMMKINDNKTINNIKTTENIGTFNYGLAVNSIYTDFSAGSFRRTDGELDFAISNGGYFTVDYVDINGESSTKYTRDGSFKLGPDRELVTSQGFAVQGQNGPIIIPDGTVPLIDDIGQVWSGGEVIDQLKITSFEDERYLEKFGDNFYNIQEGGIEKPFIGNITQGFLESSNVNSVKEMVEMITLSRAYEANSKIISTHNDILGKAVNDVGRK